MNKIVVTGANGFFASRFIEFHKKKNNIYIPTTEESIKKCIEQFSLCF